MVRAMERNRVAAPSAPADRSHMPSHVPTGATLLAVQLSQCSPSAWRPASPPAELVPFDPLR
jgi:hypothetical protein